MVPRLSLITPAVVAGQPSHQFLVIAAGYVVEEVGCSATAKGRGGSTVMDNHHIAIFAFDPFEAFSRSHRSSVARDRWVRQNKEGEAGEWWR